MKTNCERIRELLAPYLCGELNEREAGEVARHAETCAACGEELAVLRGAADFLRERLSAEAVEPRLGAERMAALCEAQGDAPEADGAKVVGIEKPPKRRAVFSPFWSMAAALLVAAIGFSPVYLNLGGMQPGGDAATQPKSETEADKKATPEPASSETPGQANNETYDPAQGTVSQGDAWKNKGESASRAPAAAASRGETPARERRDAGTVDAQAGAPASTHGAAREQTASEEKFVYPDRATIPPSEESFFEFGEPFNIGAFQEGDAEKDGDLIYSYISTPEGRIAIDDRFVVKGEQAGRVLRDGEIASMTAPPQPTPAPRDERFSTDMYFQDHGVNPFVDASVDPLSTFAVDVDTASYTMARNYLQRGQLPPAAAIRVEEIVNYFPARYAAPSESTFAVYSEMAPSPFGKGFHLLKIGVKGREIPESERKPLVLTFVIDVSGSMAREDRLELVKRTLYMLINQLRPDDRIGIAVYGTNGRELLPHTPVAESEKIFPAIGALKTEGSTNLEEGLKIGYQMARRAFDADAVNRVLLCSDGVANNGLTHPDSLLGEVEAKAGDDIYLTALGFGMGNYNDVLMEQLADKGNGHYAYLDTDVEAQRFISSRLIGSMEVIAQDVKIQVAFDPGAVASYRLIGFENRDVADKDFRNDAVDAGEIGAGHAVTALYEIKLTDAASDGIGNVAIRFKQPDKGLEVKEIDGRIGREAVSRTFEATGDHFKLAAIAAEYGEILRNSYWARGSEMKDVAELFDRAFPGNPPSPEAGELRGLIDAAEKLIGTRPAPAPPMGPTRPAPGPDGETPLDMEEG